MTPNGNRLYVVNGTAAQLVVFDIAPDGQLTQIPGSPFPAGITTTRGVAITPDGRYLYLANFAAGANSVSGFELGASGAPTVLPGSPFPAGDRPLDLALTPDGGRLFVTNVNGANISGFAINADGSLTPAPGTPFAAGTSPYGIAVAPDGLHVYAANFSSASVSGYATGPDGALAAVPGSPFPVTSQPTGVVASPDGRHLYVAHIGMSQISAHQIGADGALTQIAGSPFPAGVTNPDDALAITPNQAPVAAFTAAANPAGQASAFDASGSSDPDGQPARFTWDFGDGASLADGGPTPTHTYAVPGIYTVTLTVTDNEGCSTAFVFTGQTASCNGSAAARTSQEVQIVDGTAPALKLAGRRTQALDSSVEVKAKCDEPCDVLATGKIVVTTPSGRDGKVARRRSGHEA